MFGRFWSYDEKEVSLLESDKKSCIIIAYWVMLQCVSVFALAPTVIYCLWDPKQATYEYDKLARIMYLYDPKACGYIRLQSSLTELIFDNDTGGANVVPIFRDPAVTTVTTRLSEETRNYIKSSIYIHVVWLLIAIALRIFLKSNSPRVYKTVLTIFYFGTLFTICYDISMGIVYLSHIQQSMTKGMIARYSGWAVELKIQTPDDFAGWLPLTASACWLRGIIFLGLNIYSCNIISRIRRKIKKREVKTKLQQTENMPIPEAMVFNEPNRSTILFRS